LAGRVPFHGHFKPRVCILKVASDTDNKRNDAYLKKIQPGGVKVNPAGVMKHAWDCRVTCLPDENRRCGFHVKMPPSCSPEPWDQTTGITRDAGDEGERVYPQGDCDGPGGDSVAHVGNTGQGTYPWSFTGGRV